MKSKTYSALLGIITALLVQAGSASPQQAQHVEGKVKLLRTPTCAGSQDCIRMWPDFERV
jgi:hypothetical protein